MPRVLGGSQGDVLFFMGEVPLWTTAQIYLGWLRTNRTLVSLNLGENFFGDEVTNPDTRIFFRAQSRPIKSVVASYQIGAISIKFPRLKQSGWDPRRRLEHLLGGCAPTARSCPSTSARTSSAVMYPKSDYS